MNSQLVVMLLECVRRRTTPNPERLQHHPEKPFAQRAKQAGSSCYETARLVIPCNQKTHNCLQVHLMVLQEFTWFQTFTVDIKPWVVEGRASPPSFHTDRSLCLSWASMLQKECNTTKAPPFWEYIISLMHR